MLNIHQKVRIISGPHAGIDGVIAGLHDNHWVAVKVTGNILVVNPHEVGDEEEWQQIVAKMAYDRFLWRTTTKTPGSALDDWITAETALYLIQKIGAALAI